MCSSSIRSRSSQRSRSQYLSFPTNRTENMPENASEGWNITDKRGLRALSYFFLVSCVFIALIVLFGSGYQAFKVSKSKSINSTLKNETSKNSTSMTKAYDAFASFVNIINSNASSSYWFAIGLLSILPGVFLWNNMARGSVDADKHHWTIISVVKTVVMGIFFISICCVRSDESRTEFYFISFLSSPEFWLISKFLGFDLDEETENEIQNKSIGSTLRFYFHHRNLILFQLLNLTITLFTTIYILMKLYEYFPIHAYPCLMMMAYCVLYVMHNYGLMVIMLATALQNWDQNDGAVSFKNILKSMFTISRYHLGTAVSSFFYYKICHTPFSAIYALIQHFNIQNQFIAQVVIANDECVNKHLMMFTAIYGQDKSEAKDSLEYFGRKNQLVLPDFQNNVSTAWAEILGRTIFTLFLTMPFRMSSYISDLFAVLPILMYYIAVIATFFYVFVNTMNIAENTIEFCKIIKKQDIEAMIAERSETVASAMAMARSVERNETNVVA